MVGQNRVFKLQRTQLANDTYSLFIRVSLNLTVPHGQPTLFLYAHSRNDSRARLHQIVQTENTVLHSHLPLLEHDYGVLYFVKTHPIHVLVLQLLDFALFVLENVQDVLVLHKLILDVVL